MQLFNGHMLPTVLYKYRRWSAEFHRSILERNEIFLASPRSLDDPQDCHLVPEYQLLSEAEIMERLAWGVAARSRKNLTLEGIVAEAKKRMHRSPLNRPKYRKKSEKLIRRRTDDRFGVFSCSTDAYNVRLWNEYSDEHRGFCVGFDAFGLEQFCDAFFEHTELVLSLEGVEYSDATGIDPRLGPEETVLKQLTTKGTAWAYQNEVRLILVGATDKRVTLPQGLVREVILGARIGESDRDEICAVIASKRPSPNLLQAELCDNSTRLRFVRVES
jgi:hypothetical protein